MVGHRAIFLEAPVTNADPTGSWVVGWWKVNDGNQCYYYFDVDGHVQYTKKTACDSVSAAQVSIEFRHVHLRTEQAGPFFRRLPGTRALGICLCRSRWYALPARPAPTTSTLQHVRPEAN